MSDIIKHWAESLEVGDRCTATIRHENDGSKNIHNVPVIIIENNIKLSQVIAWGNENEIIIPYNELNKPKTNNQ